MDMMTFNIAICDDVKLWHQEIADSCRAFFADKEVNLFFYSYYSGEEIIKEKNRDIDILFLDIEMGELSGLDALVQLEEMANIKAIIFITSHLEAAQYAYGYKPIGFITKPIRKEELFTKLRTVYSKKIADTVVSFSDNFGTYHVRKSDIIYIEADSNYCNIHTKKGVMVISYTLKKCEEILHGTPFLRVHKSFVVNLIYVKNKTGSGVNLINNVTIPIGRNYKEVVNKAYRQYLTLELNV